jgi:hypothetical protein
VHTSTKIFVVWKSSAGIFPRTSIHRPDASLCQVPRKLMPRILCTRTSKNETRKISLSRQIARQGNISVESSTLRCAEQVIATRKLAWSSSHLEHCHAERSHRESAAIPVAQSKHPYQNNNCRRLLPKGRKLRTGQRLTAYPAFFLTRVPIRNNFRTVPVGSRFI